MILAESALEPIPDQMMDHPTVRKRHRTGRQQLLDISWHWAAMKGLQNVEKRGRPDLVHFAVLSALSSPLYRQGKMRFYIHTVQDKTIHFARDVRIPRSYHRFEGLLSELFTVGSIRALLRIEPLNLADLIDIIQPSTVTGLSRTGRDGSCKDMVQCAGTDPCVVIGGFQRGSFSPVSLRALPNLLSISTHPLEAHAVVSRIIYEFEMAETSVRP